MSKAEIKLSPLAFSKIIDWTSTNTEREIGGYLIGKILIDSIILTDAVFATAESNPTYVSFDNMLQFRILEELEKKDFIDFFESKTRLLDFLEERILKSIK